MAIKSVAVEVVWTGAYQKFCGVVVRMLRFFRFGGEPMWRGLAAAWRDINHNAFNQSQGGHLAYLNACGGRGGSPSLRAARTDKERLPTGFTSLQGLCAFASFVVFLLLEIDLSRESIVVYNPNPAPKAHRTPGSTCPLSLL